MKTLYDFLFVDQEKMRSLYAQIYEGLLDVMVATDSSTQGKTTDLKMGGDPVGGFSSSRREEYSEGKQESMVPHDLVLRDVLAKLKTEKFILDDPQAVGTGNLILLHGELALMDANLNLNLFKAIPKLATDFAATNRKKSRQDSEEQKNLKNFMTLVQTAIDSIQPVLQFRVASDGHEVWGAISQEHMRQPINSLLMQYGQMMPGLWSVLGIVDHVKNSDSPILHKHPLPESQGGLEDALKAMREIFQTPDNAICVTPLVIFRQIVGCGA